MRGKELNKICHPNRCNALCLGFCLNPSSMVYIIGLSPVWIRIGSVYDGLWIRILNTYVVQYIGIQAKSPKNDVCKSELLTKLSCRTLSKQKLCYLFFEPFLPVLMRYRKKCLTPPKKSKKSHDNVPFSMGKGEGS